MIVIIALSQIPYSAKASTAWVAHENQYFFSAGISHAISYSKNVILESYKYKYIQSFIQKLEEDILKLRGNFKLPKYVRQQRIDIINEKILSLKDRQNKLKKKFTRDVYNIYIEGGINSHYSLGLEANRGISLDYMNDRTSFSNLYIFGKRKLFENKNWMVSGELGFTIEDERKNRARPTTRLNIAHIKTYETGRKLISSVSFSSSIDNILANISAEASETLEFLSGYSIQLSSYYQYSKNYTFGYKYFYKDQLTVAKNLKNDRIPSLNNTTLSLGLYQDYFYKNRKPGAKGVYCGIWVKL